MTTSEQAWLPVVHKLLMQCRRELGRELEGDSLVISNNYFDRILDALIPGAQVKVRHLEGSNELGNGIRRVE